MNTTIDKAVLELSEFVCDIIDCDRATIYSLDHGSNTLWSKAATGSSQRFTVPVGVGIAGLCASNSQIINIPNAYEDKRFNREFDRLTGYKTKTILAMPIVSKTGTVEGVVQVINKAERRSGDSSNFFTREDEGILDMLSRMAGLFLRSTIHLSEQHYLVSCMSSILKLGSILGNHLNEADLISNAEDSIEDLLLCQEVRIYLLDIDEASIYFYDDRLNKISNPSSLGIVGKLIESNEFGIKIDETYNHRDFNSK